MSFEPPLTDQSNINYKEFEHAQLRDTSMVIFAQASINIFAHTSYTNFF